MPNSNLFAVCNKGRIFFLKTDQAKWEELPYLGIDFKFVSAHDTVIWALGGDHQIYVFVYGTSVPIRVCEESYENQRWNPVEGFTSNLLPSDRHNYSSSDGLHSRYFKDIHLPSLAWKWEGDWHLQETFEGKSVGKEGWTYAVDFPRTYHPEKSWRSCVRRRLWLRYRQYIALDTWSIVDGLHKDPAEEPFISVSVGGGEVNAEDSDKLMVWAISAFGRVFVREGVSANNPEGQRWAFVATPTNQDVTSLSVGRSGRVWALTWDGSALVRTGVSRDHPHGVAWCRVEPPGYPLKQLSVGKGVAWAVSRCGFVHFRKGLSSVDNGDIGSAWSKMAGTFLMFSVGPNDQVWGITADDYSIVVRTGVTATEPDGKMWKIINLPLHKFDPERRFSSLDDESQESTSLEEEQSEIDQISQSGVSARLNTESPDAVSMTAAEDICSVKVQDTSTREDSHSSAETIPSITSQDLIKTKENESLSSTVKPEIDSVSASTMDDIVCDEIISLKIRCPDDEMTSSVNSSVSDTPINYIEPDFPCEDNNMSSILLSKDLNPIPVSISETSGSRSEINHFDHSSEEASKKPYFIPRKDSVSSSPNSDVFALTSRQGSWGQEETAPLELTFPEENLWMCVSGSGCWVQHGNMPKWFLADYSNFFNKSLQWRASIVSKLQRRKEREFEKFKNYEEAIECSSWVLNGQCRILIAGQWVSSCLELTMTRHHVDSTQDVALKIMYTLRSKKMTSLSCSSIVLCTLIVDLPSKAILSLYTPTQPLQPFRLLFSTEKDAEEWLGHFNSILFCKNEKKQTQNQHCIWAINNCGLIYLHECGNIDKYSVSPNIPRYLTDYQTTLPFIHQLDKHFYPGSWITLEGKINVKANRFRIDLMTGAMSESVAFHFNPRFPENVVVMNSKDGDIWGVEESQLLKFLQRGQEFKISVSSDDTHLNINVNGKLFCNFSHRCLPSDISHVYVAGDIVLNKIVYQPSQLNVASFSSYSWCGVGGHLRSLECGAGGVVWGIAYDSHVYVYEGVLGGGVFGSGFTDSKTNSLTDLRHFHVWENERWNPLSGFSHRGLPTDRYTWSDQSGKYERTKEATKLPSRHWQWVGDWAVDYHTPGGVDKEGWQYATDFPMSFHGSRYVTDLVRRRRWVRKARVATSGPWKQMEKVALVSVSISVDFAADGTVPVWGVSASSEIVFREGVTPGCPSGKRWSLISSGMPMKEVSAGGVHSGVWAVSASGLAHMRMGITDNNPKGVEWVNIESASEPLVQVGSGRGRVWALDRGGSVYRRVNVQPQFAQGTEWERVCDGVSRISVSAVDGSLWAVLASYSLPSSSRNPQTTAPASGVIARRKGVSDKHPAGLGWDIVPGTGWTHVSAAMAKV